MPIYSGTQKITPHRGDQSLSRVYRGDDLVWQNKVDLKLERAATQPYRIMFMGSSTTQGYLIEKNEGYVNNMLGAFLTAQPMVEASPLVHQNSGSISAPTAPGFHFLNAGLGGTTSANYYGSARGNLVSGFKPTLVMHMIGSNDYQHQMAISTYTANLNSVLSDIDSRVGGSQNVKHILIQSYRRTDRADTGITWAQYGQALSNVAAGRSNTTYIDTMPRFNAYGWSDRDLMPDRIHTTVAGYQLLARFISQELGLDDREGQTIWAIDAEDFPQIADGTPASNFPSTSDSMQRKNVSSSGSARPLFRNTSSGKWFQFDGSNDYMDITSGFDGAHGMPITFYAVVESLGGTAGTETQPFFSRSVNGDNGWWWAWREKSANTIKAALNSAFGNPNHMDNLANNLRGVIAVTMFSNSRGVMYINSKYSTPVNAEVVDPNLGPWMKSLRLGANSDLSSFSAMDLREMRFEHGGWDVEHVRSRIAQLAQKHSINIETADPKEDVRIWMPFNTSIVQQAGVLSPRNHITGSPEERDQYAYFPANSRYRLTYSDTWSEGWTVAMWINQTDSQSGWTDIFHRAISTGTIVNEMYIVHNLATNNPRIHTGLKLGGSVREVVSTAQFPRGQWGHLAVVYRRLSNRSIFNVRIYHNGVEIGNTNLSGYSTNGLFDKNEPLHLAGNRANGVWGGSIDDFMVWDRPLSQSEVNSLIQGKNDPPLP